ncbi:hypothetical protein [Pseudomonas prosekii]|nr:hypothetical protein [Pseudomonas prosekii]
MDNLTRILLTKYQPDSPLLQEALQAPVEAVTKQALSADEEASTEAVIAFKAALELLAARERADKLVALAKQAKLTKGKQ